MNVPKPFIMDLGIDDQPIYAEGMVIDTLDRYALWVWDLGRGRYQVKCTCPTMVLMELASGPGVPIVLLRQEFAKEHDLPGGDA